MTQDSASSSTTGWSQTAVSSWTSWSRSAATSSKGISSLVDVAGGFGGATQTIAKAFPHVECSVLDLAHVIASAPTNTNVKYIVGDMFESIPSANVVFLKVRIRTLTRIAPP